MVDGNFVYNATVSIPSLGLHTQTRIDGTFTLPNVIYGQFLFEATMVPLDLVASLLVDVPPSGAVLLQAYSSFCLVDITRLLISPYRRRPHCSAITFKHTDFIFFSCIFE